MKRILFILAATLFLNGALPTKKLEASSGNIALMVGGGLVVAGGAYGAWRSNTEMKKATKQLDRFGKKVKRLRALQKQEQSSSLTDDELAEKTEIEETLLEVLYLDEVSEIRGSKIAKHRKKLEEQVEKFQMFQWGGCGLSVLGALLFGWGLMPSKPLRVTGSVWAH